MAREMLQKWVARFGHNATINYIVNALMDPVFALYDVAKGLAADAKT